jgi:hypothetical protein
MLWISIVFLWFKWIHAFECESNCNYGSIGGHWGYFYSLNAGWLLKKKPIEAQHSTMLF